LRVVGHDGDHDEIVKGRPGARVELGEYVIEFVEVAENDEGGYATVKVTPKTPERNLLGTRDRGRRASPLPWRA
jgi:hypothetical protein